MKTNPVIHVYGDHVDTDTIIPGQYLTARTERELGAHCLEGLDPGFIGRVRAGDVIVAGRNFGCGSSREHAPIAIKAAGVSCVIARSFARIFYRNAVNIGLPVFECPELVDAASMGEPITVDLEAGVFSLRGKVFQAEAASPYVQRIVRAGGLVPFTREELAARRSGGKV